jgi:hypothetical protein
MDFLMGRIKGGKVEGKVALRLFRLRHFEYHRVSDLSLDRSWCYGEGWPGRE